MPAVSYTIMIIIRQKNLNRTAAIYKRPDNAMGYDHFFRIIVLKPVYSSLEYMKIQYYLINLIFYRFYSRFNNKKSVIFNIKIYHF